MGTRAAWRSKSSPNESWRQGTGSSMDRSANIRAPAAVQLSTPGEGLLAQLTASGQGTSVISPPQYGSPSVQIKADPLNPGGFLSTPVSPAPSFNGSTSAPSVAMATSQYLGSPDPSPSTTAGRFWIALQVSGGRHGGLVRAAFRAEWGGADRLQRGGSAPGCRCPERFLPRRLLGGT